MVDPHHHDVLGAGESRWFTSAQPHDLAIPQGEALDHIGDVERPCGDFSPAHEPQR